MSASKPVLPGDASRLQSSVTTMNRFCKTVGRALKREDGSDVPEPHPRRLASWPQQVRAMEAHIAANSERVELDLTTEEARRDARKHVVRV